RRGRDPVSRRTHAVRDCNAREYVHDALSAAGVFWRVLPAGRGRLADVRQPRRATNLVLRQESDEEELWYTVFLRLDRSTRKERASMRQADQGMEKAAREHVASGTYGA